MEGDGEAVGFVADGLDDVEDGVVAVEADGFVLLAVDVDDLFAFGDGGDGLVGDAEGFEGFGGGVELAEAAVDEDDAGELGALFFEAGVAAGDDFAHGGEVVVAGDRLDDEFAVVGLFHLAVLPDDHGGDFIGALDVGDVEAFDAAGGSGEVEGVFEGVGDGLGGGFEDAEAGFKAVFGVGFGEVEESFFFAALGGADFDAAAAFFGEEFGEGFAVFKVVGDVDDERDVALVEVDLLEEGGEEFGGVEVEAVFPVELAAVDDAAVADVKEVDGEERGFGVVGEDVDVVAVGGGHFLGLGHFLDGDEVVAEAGGAFEIELFGGFGDLVAEVGFEVFEAAFEEEAGLADGLGVFGGGDEAFDAGAEAAADVVLQAGVGVFAVEVDFAGGDFELAVDEVGEAVGEVAGEVGTEVGGAVFAEAAGDEDAGDAFAREFDVGVGFVVLEEDVEAGLVLLDEVVFEGEGLFFVFDDDVVEVGGFGDEGTGFGFREAVVGEVVADAGAEVLRFADVDDVAEGVFVEINARQEGQLRHFLAEIHRTRCVIL